MNRRPPPLSPASSSRSRPRVVVRPWCALVASAGLLLAACGAPPDDDVEPRSQALAIPAKGDARTFDVASWNIEWFGSTANGPTDEALQLANVADVVRSTDFDLWGVAEVVGKGAFDRLVGRLPGYRGLLASDPSVVGGAAHYARDEQKVGLLYKSAVARVLRAKVILADEQDAFAGRPPLEVALELSIGQGRHQLVVVVLHAKASADAASWARRQRGAAALKAYLEAAHPTGRVLVIGDFNDDVDTSITRGKPSPYAAFVADAADYTFPTKALSEAGQSSTVTHPGMIDHHLVTNELRGAYLPGSAEVDRVDRFVAGYGRTTSDHFPVLTRYAWGTAAVGDAPAE